jgi:hypothetical protein
MSFDRCLAVPNTVRLMQLVPELSERYRDLDNG